MRININQPGDRQFSVMQRIINGTLTIDSIDEFEEILEIYEKDPLLYRRYADLLLQKERILDAVEAYSRTAELFLDLNMSLQAIVAKILQWSIQKPTHEQGRAFYALLHEEGAAHTPLEKFWARMRYPELTAVMLRLVRLRLPIGTTVIRVNDPADDLFFIVSGSVAEVDRTEAPDGINQGAEGQSDPVLLAENDIFGDIFPLHQPTFSRKDIRVTADVELVKIAKSVLFNVCRKHPQIESLLKQLYKPENRNKGGGDRIWQTVRRNLRFGVPTRAEVIFQPAHSTENTWTHNAIAVDLSLGGVCLDLGTKNKTNDDKDKLPHKGRSVRIRLCLSEEDQDLYATGTVVWINQERDHTSDAIYLGVRFDPLNAIDQDRLLDFCADQGGEQTLLWSLWDTMLKANGTN